MPLITPETPRDEITIAGDAYTVPAPYSAGHVLLSNEAHALNAAFGDSIRNILATGFKELKAAGTFDQSAAQAEVDSYAAKYEFGIRSVRTGNPLVAKSMEVAREFVSARLAKKGILATTSGKDITRLARDVLDSGKFPQIVEEAKKRLESIQDIADDELDSFFGESEVAPAESASHKGKTKAA